MYAMEQIFKKKYLQYCVFYGKKSKCGKRSIYHFEHYQHLRHGSLRFKDIAHCIKVQKHINTKYLYVTEHNSYRKYKALETTLPIAGNGVVKCKEGMSPFLTTSIPAENTENK